jgi:hypothetical protein
MTVYIVKVIKGTQPLRGKSIFRNPYLPRTQTILLPHRMSHLMIILSWIW